MVHGGAGCDTGCRLYPVGKEETNRNRLDEARESLHYAERKSTELKCTRKGLEAGAIEKLKKAREIMCGGDHRRSLYLFSGIHVLKDPANAPELAYRALLRQLALKPDSGHFAM